MINRFNMGGALASLLASPTRVDTLAEWVSDAIFDRLPSSWWATRSAERSWLSIADRSET